MRNNHKKHSIKERLTLWRKTRVLKTGEEMPDWIHKYRRGVHILALITLLFLIFQSGLKWQLPSVLHLISVFIDYAVFFCFLLDAVLTFFYTFPKSRYLKENWLDFLVFIPVFSNLISIQSGAGLVIVRYVLIMIKLFARTRKFSNLLRDIRLNTAQIVAFSFAFTILVGTLLLTFPAATVDGKGTPFIDALFTSTSATCVTGLIVRDTPVYFSGFGQMVILALIQMGGLGIMTYSAFVALLLGRFSLGQRKLVQEMFEEEQNAYSMILYIFKMTFAVELVGVLALFIRWSFHFKNPLQTLYFSIFHSISAFCNAGFSLFSNSMEDFVSDPFINLVIMILIIVGGLGFIVVFDITRRVRRPRRPLSPHSKLILTTSGILILLGFIAIFFFEFDGTLMSKPLSGKLWASMFQSVTTRTAGFNSIPIGSMTSISLSIMIILMFIGASPGSTGGGIKTSTFAVLLLSVKSIFQGKQEIVAYQKTIPTSSVIKAAALLICALILVALVFLFLIAVEDKPYLPLLFETVSAFGTVGLSMGITPDLTAPGKLLITLLMFLGRIGPLTMGLALAREMTKAKIGYPDARIMIG
jgi:trk system potassium uptake protein TrkH